MSDKTTAPLTIHRPATVSPLVIDSPHCGTDYPADFRYACDLDELRRCEDTHVGALFEDAARAHGAAFLAARFPRSYIDVNRPLSALDPARIAGGWPGKSAPSQKYVRLGRGLVWERLRTGGPIYDRRLSAAEIKSRIARCYLPYHAELSGMLDAAHHRHGAVWHLDCHSMGSDAPFPGRGRNPKLADFVLGDRRGR